MESDERGMTVLMFPWLGHSHVSSYLQLGKRLARRGFSIYLCSTPVNLASVKQALVNNPSIKTVELHLPNLPELPPHHHTANGLPPNLWSSLKKAFDMAAPQFSDILQTIKPDLLIYDLFQYWAPEVALSQNVPSVLYITSGAVTCCYMFHHKIHPQSPFPFPEIYLTDFDGAKYQELAKVSTHGITTAERFNSCVTQARIILLKTCNEIEGKYINYLLTLCEKPVLPVGLLASETVDFKEDEHAEIFDWLNKKDEASTVFVSFGSECYLSKEDIEELASGLELSCLSFIWVVRYPVEDEFTKEFCKEVRQRVGEKGMIIETWAPQARILKHPSIGGFVSHCGRGSVTEALAYGIPIIGIPMQLDQPLNARMVQGAGLGEEAKRNGNGRLQGATIARVINKIVVDKDGDEIRKNSKILSKSVRDDGDKYFDIAVAELNKLCNIV